MENHLKKAVRFYRFESPRIGEYEKEHQSLQRFAV